MIRQFLLTIALMLPGYPVLAQDCPDTLDFSFRALAGEQETRLCEDYADKVVLVVNTASYCGFTSQYEGLEALYERYRERGFAVLGFPSNDFAQEPGSEQEIQSFCRLTYSVEFPMYEKIHVKGAGAHPFFEKLAALGGGYPQWNFHKYLLDRNGNVVASFVSRIRPTDPEVIAAIEQLL